MPGAKTKVSCANCGKTNFYPADTAGKKVVCGSCRHELPLPGFVLEPTGDQTSGLIWNSSLPLLLDFYSPTCGPCHVMHPVLERLARRRAGELMVVKINVEAQPELARGFGIQAVPTFVIVHKGTERDRASGAMAEDSFALWVASRA